MIIPEIAERIIDWIDSYAHGGVIGGLILMENRGSFIHILANLGLEPPAQSEPFLAWLVANQAEITTGLRQFCLEKEAP